jgi:hypothetical protein
MNVNTHCQVMQSKTIVKFGIAAIAMGAFFGVGIPVKADQLVWVRAQQLDYFKVRGLVPPGAYFHDEYKKPATIAVNKAGHGVGEQTTSKPGQRNAHKADERWLNIHKSRSLGGA